MTAFVVERKHVLTLVVHINKGKKNISRLSMPTIGFYEHDHPLEERRQQQYMVATASTEE